MSLLKCKHMTLKYVFLTQGKTNGGVISDVLMKYARVKSERHACS